MGELRSQHMDTTLGNVWHLLNPILLIAVYYLVFDVVLDVSVGWTTSSRSSRSGVLSYQWAQRSITAGARSITGNEGLIRSLQFPRALLPDRRRSSRRRWLPARRRADGAGGAGHRRGQSRRTGCWIGAGVRAAGRVQPRRGAAPGTIRRQVP
jgi:hypothetical protein